MFSAAAVISNLRVNFAWRMLKNGLFATNSLNLNIVTVEETHFNLILDITLNLTSCFQKSMKTHHWQILSFFTIIWAPSPQKAKMCLGLWGNSEGPDHIKCAVWSGTSLSAKKIIGYYRMYEWRARIRWQFVHERDNLNVCILRMFESTFFVWYGPFTTNASG